MFVFGVFLVRIQSKCRKIWTRKTPNTETFYTVITIKLFLSTDLLMYYMKTSENQRFSNVFRGDRKKQVAWNGLI